MNDLAVASLVDAPLIPETGIRHVNFFNGRLLTATDLQAQQVADRLGRHQLGRAIGAGVADGLGASLVSDGTDGMAPIVAVSGGLALTRTGQAVELPVSRVHVTLARRLPALPVDAGLFRDCDLPGAGPDLTGKGAYVLTIAPASAYREQAPMVAVGGNGKATGCGARYSLEGSIFRLVEVPPEAFAGVSQATRDLIDTLRAEADDSGLSDAARRARVSRLRNLLAHACFGTEELASFLPGSWRRAVDGSPTPTYGALDAMWTAGALTDCDVPLALVYWSTTGLKFVDTWAVRRRPVPGSPAWLWPQPLDLRRLAEGEAMLAQFQAHVESMPRVTLSQSELSQVQARNYFRYLPPAGLLPLRRGGILGFDKATFFDDFAPHAAAMTDANLLRALLHDAFHHAPVDLDAQQSAGFRLYEVWENAQAAQASASIQRVIVFASHALPRIYGIGRYATARWDWNRFA
jgi:hypothetical protein